jgi:hypothetical protein
MSTTAEFLLSELSESDLLLLKKHVRAEVESEFEADLITELAKYVAEVRAELEASHKDFTKRIARIDSLDASTHAHAPSQ